MKILLFLYAFVSPTLTFGTGISAYTNCIAPSQYFLGDKIRESFHLDKGELELYNIVKDEKNYELREEIKSLKRSLLFANRRQVPHLFTKLKSNYQQMAANADTEEVIKDYPVKGASSVVEPTEEGKLQITMDRLTDEGLDFIPPETLKKLDKKVTIQYNYPIDSFDYFLTFDGHKVPMEKAMYKMLTDFEDACALKKIENGAGSRTSGTRQ